MVLKLYEFGDKIGFGMSSKIRLVSIYFGSILVNKNNFVYQLLI
jgi:hypothetical protein